MARYVDPGEYATAAEVEQALGELSPADLLRLDAVAKFRAGALAGLGLGIGANDLLQEAIMRTIAGTRRWRRKVTFVKHLVETMRSLASHAYEPLEGAELVPANGDAAHDGVALAATTPDGRKRAEIREQLAMIAGWFRDDDEVSRVLEGLAEGRTGPDIQRDLGISATQYATIITRLRRGVDRRTGGRS